MEYTVQKATILPEMRGLWDSPAWKQAAVVEVANFRPEGSEHRPRTQARLLYSDDRLYGIFRVEDQYVRCTRTAFQDAVCKDSCVEFFVRPKQDKGYFNFEFNCGGTMLCWYSLITPQGRQDPPVLHYRAAHRRALAHAAALQPLRGRGNRLRGSAV